MLAVLDLRHIPVRFRGNVHVQFGDPICLNADLISRYYFTIDYVSSMEFAKRYRCFVFSYKADPKPACAALMNQVMQVKLAHP